MSHYHGFHLFKFIIIIICIKWIVLHEDINYQIEKNYEGCKMSIDRYLETIFFTQNNSYTLEDIISKSVKHSHIKQWPDMGN